jgi:hypothetical protein
MNNGLPTASSLATARRLSGEHPTQLLPCPVCGASVKGENLPGHLRKVHDAADAEASSGALSSDVTWTGVDYAVAPLTLGPVALWCVAGGALAISGPSSNDFAMNVLAALSLVVILPPLLVGLGKLKARLEIRGDRLRLTYCGGLLKREVRLSAKVAVGRLRTTRSSAITSAYAADAPDGWGNEVVDAGHYLRFEEGSRSITVGSPKGTAFRKHWDPSGWRSGSKRRRWDVTLGREAMLDLEYQLAARGLLRPRRASD